MTEKTCSVEGCEKPARNQGWCRMHYQRWYRTGDLNGVRERAPFAAGRKFGRLTVLGIASSGKRRLYDCRCECGSRTVVEAWNLKSGHVQSCGCVKRTHEMTGTLTYSSVVSAIKRCRDPKTSAFEHYGGANPRVEFRYGATIEEALTNVIADIGERPPGTSFGRFGDVGHYEPGNCAWQTRAEQAAEAMQKRARAKSG